MKLEAEIRAYCKAAVNNISVKKNKGDKRRAT
jgi:hypothetical protein